MDRTITVGRTAGPGRATGLVRTVERNDIVVLEVGGDESLSDRVFEEYGSTVAGEVLLTPELLPPLVPTARRADAILTYESTSLTSKAAVFAREHGIPCVVGLESMEDLEEGKTVVVDASAEEVNSKDSGRVLAP
jgi:phosphohistidine swiveling domain-containing protein